MPAPPFPPTSNARFRVPGEEYADGFVMDFDVTGTEFRIRLDLPRPADPGEAYLIFYASFYHEGATESMIETGLSVSGTKGWNLLSKITGTTDASDCRFDKHHDPRDRAPVDLIVKFGTPDHSGPAKNHKAAPAAASGHELVTVSAAGRSRLDRIPKFKPVGRVRLIIAAANNKHGHFGEAGISLEEVDKKRTAAVGKLVWVPGLKMTVGDRRIELITQASNGFTCDLPPADAAA